MEKGADLIILDDGHQTTSLYKDLSFVVVDKLQAFGNGCVMPAGPLRENLSEGIERSDAFIGVGEDAVSPFRPSFRGRYIFPAVDLPLNRVFAFCGLGFPQKFYKTLTDLGAELVGTKSFPDHYMYKEEDFIRLEKLAKDHKAVLITTRKDFVKIPASWQERLHVLDISFQFEDSEGLYNFILQHIPSLKGVA